jgi:hypothetical protein
MLNLRQVASCGHDLSLPNAILQLDIDPRVDGIPTSICADQLEA